MSTITQADLATYRGKFISVTSGMSGHFAVMYWWNKDLGGFWEPWDTGIGRYETEDEARVEAITWADADGVPYLIPSAAKASTS